MPLLTTGPMRAAVAPTTRAEVELSMVATITTAPSGPLMAAIATAIHEMERTTHGLGVASRWRTQARER
jgi:hypothetical protein